MKELITYITSLVESYTNISYDMMRLETRKREIVEARQLVCYLSSKYAILGPNPITRYGLQNYIADHFGIDHATVTYAIKTIQKYLDSGQQSDIKKICIEICSILKIDLVINQKQLVKL